MKEEAILLQERFLGEEVDAIYNETDDPSVAGNPFIEALPGRMEIWEICDRIENFPSINESERKGSACFRMDCIDRLNGFISALPLHFSFADKLTSALRGGYLSRNPTSTAYVARLRSMDTEPSEAKKPANQYNLKPRRLNNPHGFLVAGDSGVGKTTATQGLLSQYPQIICHTRISQKQLVWMHLECPKDCSPLSLCCNFFHAYDCLFGTDHLEQVRRNRMNTDLCVIKMRKLAATQGLGVLVIDEINRLTNHKFEREGSPSLALFNFLVDLINNIGVPIIFVGTNEIKALAEFAKPLSRRCSGQGFIDATPISEKWWNNRFLPSLWKYQWLKEETPLTPEIQNTFYRVTGGFVDAAVIAYRLIQKEAITRRTEVITPELITSVAEKEFPLLARHLQQQKPQEIVTLKLPSSLNSQEQITSVVGKPKPTEKKEYSEGLVSAAFNGENANYENLKENGFIGA